MCRVAVAWRGRPLTAKLPLCTDGPDMLTRRRLLTLSGTATLAPSLISLGALAQLPPGGWPNRSIHLIVPLAAGGPTDSVARILATPLGARLGQDVVVENKPGAGTNIGNEFVAHSDPDGYTALYGTSSLATNASLYRSLSYDPFADLAPVSLVAKFPFFMMVPNSSPAKTVMEFIDYAKAHPGKMIMGSPGTGSGPQLAEALFLQMAGITMTHAPYRGAAPAFVDLIPGRIDCYFGSGELLTYSRSGQVRALATTGATRSPAAPEVPTIEEAGVAGYVVDSWQGVFAPSKTPPEIIGKMSDNIIAALAEPAIKDELAQLAYTAQGSSPDELRKFLKSDTEKWSAVIKSAGITIEQ
jgi:tripartite-type tricarboxylate transporter receptor subunit TctC